MKGAQPSYAGETCRTALSGRGIKHKMLYHALRYAERGWPVLPLHRNSKLPATGYKDATIDPETIIAWCTEHPYMNIGICTGADSGLVVLDDDGEQGFESLIKLALHSGSDMPQTLTSLTPRGRHHYFKYPDVVIKTRGIIKLGQDGRATGEHIVAPPSRFHGKNYRWNDPEETIAEMPEWFLRAISN
jgi:putative DNA primase/helicase